MNYLSSCAFAPMGLPFTKEVNHTRKIKLYIHLDPLWKRSRWFFSTGGKLAKFFQLKKFFWWVIFPLSLRPWFCFTKYSNSLHRSSSTWKLAHTILILYMVKMQLSRYHRSSSCIRYIILSHNRRFHKFILRNLRTEEKIKTNVERYFQLV